jgi:integrase
MFKTDFEQKRSVDEKALTQNTPFTKIIIDGFLGGCCMKGNIYTRQKCTICDGPLNHDERRAGCFCELHPEIRASRGFYLKFGQDINKRFKTYELAYHYLIGLRYEVEQNKFDVRDHMHSNPLGFSTLAKEYLKFKEEKKLKSFYHIECYINKAIEYFHDRNIKTIKKKDIGDFLRELKVSDKTKSNYASQLHDLFYGYLYGEVEILNLSNLPKFPTIDFELGYRKIIGIQEREEIIEELKKQTYDLAPKVWLAIDMLCSYNKLRPMDLWNLKEGDIDLEFGVITIWRPTKTKKLKRPKVIRERLLDYHLEEIKKVKQECPAVASTPFFRHNGKTQGEKDTPYGVNYVYKQWKKACKCFGIEDLDLYGATRHSTTTAIAKAAGKKQARKFSGHETNKAFDRYCQISDDESYDMTQLMAKMRGKVIDLKKAKGEEK